MVSAFVVSGAVHSTSTASSLMKAEAESGAALVDACSSMEADAVLLSAFWSPSNSTVAVRLTLSFSSNMLVL